MSNTEPFFQPGRLYTTNEVMEGVKVSRSYIDRGVRSGRFPEPHRFGRKMMWRGSDMLAVIDKGENWAQSKWAKED